MFEYQKVALRELYPTMLVLNAIVDKNVTKPRPPKLSP